MSGPSFFGAPCDQPLPTNEPLRSPATVPVDSGAIAAASSEGRAAGGGGFGPSTGFAAVGLFDRRRRFFFDSFFSFFFSFLRPASTKLSRNPHVNIGGTRRIDNSEPLTFLLLAQPPCFAVFAAGGRR